MAEGVAGRVAVECERMQTDVTGPTPWIGYASATNKVQITPRVAVQWKTYIRATREEKREESSWGVGKVSNLEKDRRSVSLGSITRRKRKRKGKKKELLLHLLRFFCSSFNCSLTWTLSLRKVKKEDENVE